MSPALPLSLLACALVAGCGAPLDADADAVAIPVGAAAHALSPLPLHGQGRLRHGSRPQPCAAPRHRQFDFWVGPWNVRDTSGALIGTNLVSSELDGCVVAEHWTDSAGGRGRSLNAYDPGDGRWHQTWVADALGHLRMSGGLDAQGRMVLDGRRVAAASGVTLLDRYVWTPLPAGRVQQEGTLDIPERDLHFSFLGIYEHSATVTPVPSPGTSNCLAGGAAAASRDLDFAVGSWKIALEHGPALGRSTVRTDLSGCLFEEDLITPWGYQDKSFVYYDPTVRAWFQTLADNQGHRLELRGALSKGVLVLSGALPGPLPLTLRATWQATDSAHLRQRWEVSADGGATWLPDLTILYTRG